MSGVQTKFRSLHHLAFIRKDEYTGFILPAKLTQPIQEAVDAGYWQLYRYNPELKKQGKNPFTLDSGEPKTSFRDFIMGQIRYSSLAKEFPAISEKLFEMTEEDAMQKLATYKQLAAMDEALV